MAKSKVSLRQEFVSAFAERFGLNSDDTGVAVDGTPVRFSPSFIWHNGQIATILQLYVRPGSNREITYYDALDMIPVSPLKGVHMYLVFNDNLIKGEEKKTIIRKNAQANKDVIGDTLANGNEREKDDAEARVVLNADIEDYNAYQLMINEAQPVVDFKWQLLIIGQSQEQLEEQLDIINLFLDQTHEGVRWDSLPGEQSARYQSLLGKLDNSIYDMTSTARNYAGLDFHTSRGLADPAGVPIGKDALSLSDSTAFYDFDATTKKLGLIAIPRSAHMASYDHEDDIEPLSAASLTAQAAANHLLLGGHRTSHIVLNGFDYFEPGRFYSPVSADMVFDRFDVTKLTINPLQGFGHIEDIVPIYARLTQKIVNIFDQLENLQLTEDERAIILSALQQFYFQQGIWSSTTALYPKRARKPLVEVEHPDTFPTLGQFRSKFTTLVKAALESGRELKADKVETLAFILDQAIAENTEMLGRTTSITESTAPQVYYDFSALDSLRIKQVQFINLLDYIIYTHQPGDCIIIHGADQLYATTLVMVSETIKAAQRAGLRFIFAYDGIKIRAGRFDAMSDIFGLRGIYYTDLDIDVDWSFVGRMTASELDEYEKIMGTELSYVIKQEALSKDACKVLVHRAQGNINNFVHLDVFV